ncbi:MAG TPA: hypothetical protein VGO48_13375 [Conexibacter sp.]|jgi:hypothetical protein|nr:hypothetical protein [Conexibacter sp.]
MTDVDMADESRTSVDADAGEGAQLVDRAEREGRGMSAALPNRCWELDAPPTAALCAGSRYSEMIVTGSPRTLR